MFVVIFAALVCVGRAAANEPLDGMVIREGDVFVCCEEGNAYMYEMTNTFLECNDLEMAIQFYARITIDLWNYNLHGGKLHLLPHAGPPEEKDLLKSALKSHYFEHVDRKELIALWLIRRLPAMDDDEVPSFLDYVDSLL